jgi:hypothetical protein
MRVANISLVFTGALISVFAGAFAGGLAVGLTGNAALALLLLMPAAAGVAHLIGRWIAGRANPPGTAELKLGCAFYVAVSALLGIGSRHGAGLVGFILSVGIAWVLYQAASKRLNLSGSGAPIIG